LSFRPSPAAAVAAKWRVFTAAIPGARERARPRGLAGELHLFGVSVGIKTAAKISGDEQPSHILETAACHGFPCAVFA
jgi:hypothetical protein